ncbi:MAG: phosphoribosylformylglycinamidine cyclo-ligase [Chloroherpetonaceae bacterium]|nr:phosphoribosylformylglycinamidine cyclo-ligase [Chloroherpetonaceae bacterium]
MDYKTAGVDIDNGEEVVHRIKPLVRRTFTKGVVSDIGAFGAFFELDTTGFEKPVLVSSVDGVGTKLKIAAELGHYDTVGQCLVNHCVNDILVCGAKPLYFLDYYATGKLQPDNAVAVIGGMVKACEENGCALIGGETAEMPGVYSGTDFDLAGTIVGVVDKAKILDGKSITAGDILIGVDSNGLHTNGYSLARKVLQGKYHEPMPNATHTIGDVLLTPHRSYYKTIYPMLSDSSRFGIKGLSHITGGGLVGNTMRIIPKGLSLAVDWNAWERPEIFKLIQSLGNVPESDMQRTFNLGVGLVIVTSDSFLPTISEHLRLMGEKFRVIGKVVNTAA